MAGSGFSTLDDHQPRHLAPDLLAGVVGEAVVDPADMRASDTWRTASSQLATVWTTMFGLPPAAIRTGVSARQAAGELQHFRLDRDRGAMAARIFGEVRRRQQRHPAGVELRRVIAVRSPLRIAVIGRQKLYLSLATIIAWTASSIAIWYSASSRALSTCRRPGRSAMLRTVGARS